MDIHPSHTCFDDAFELIESLIKENPRDIEDFKQNLFLVHAICLFPDDTLFTHAWVEDKKNDTCMFKGILEDIPEYFQADRKEFYEHYRVKEFIKYSLFEMAHMNNLTGTLGPWEFKYKSLTGSNKKVMKAE